MNLAWEKPSFSRQSIDLFFGGKCRDDRSCIIIIEPLATGICSDPYINNATPVIVTFSAKNQVNPLAA